MGFPQSRPRRLRSSAAMRRLVAETSVLPRHLVLPMFVSEGARQPVPIATMPGVVQHSVESLRKAAADAAAAGVGGLMLFGVPTSKDATGSGGVDPRGILNVAIAEVVAEVGDATVVMSDLCLDEFTDHGHCGVLAPDGTVDNDATLECYAEMAVAGPMAAMTVPACGLPAMPTRLRTVDDDVKTTASNFPVLIASRVGAGGGAALTVR